jgi:hypothetical protein
MTLGWTSTDIAHAAGWKDRNQVLQILSGQNGRPCMWLERGTHDRIATVYADLAMSIPTPAPHRARTRTRARRLGYAPPLAWDDIDNDPEPSRSELATDLDPVVVMRLLQGDRVTATKAEKDAAMAQWIEQGGSQAELCRWHGWKEGRYGLALVRGEAS